MKSANDKNKFGQTDMNKIAIAAVVLIACAAGMLALMGRGSEPKPAELLPTGDLSTTDFGMTSSGGDSGMEAGHNTTVESGKNEPGDADPKLTQKEEDEERSVMVAGIWETNRDGRRVLTVLEDGTATMDVTVEGAFAFVVGSKMKFNINWLIADGSLDFEMVDGEPESSVSAVISLYGKRRVQKILEFSQEKFVLKDNDGESDHVWTRVKPAAE